jgi:hypothetical protein
MYTALQELRDFKEHLGSRRPYGGNNSLVDGAKEGSWLDQRRRKTEFEDEEPTVLIVGAGISLSQLNISSLI